MKRAYVYLPEELPAVYEEGKPYRREDGTLVSVKSIIVGNGGELRINFDNETFAAYYNATCKIYGEVYKPS